MTPRARLIRAGLRPNEADAVLANDPTIANDLELGAAWRKCEAALPEGWSLDLRRDSFGEWFAWAWLTQEEHFVPGPTPTAALLALAAKLRKAER